MTDASDPRPSGGAVEGRARSRGAGAPARGDRPPPCRVLWCPICTAVTALGEARPDLVEHLLLAGREALLALRALIDARLEGPAEPAPRLERVVVE
jgi:hypothetical protein